MSKAEEIACKKYSIKEGLNDYDEMYYNSTNVNLAKAFIEGYEYRQSEIDELKAEVERLKEGMLLIIDELYDEIPTKTVEALDLLKIIKKVINKIDLLTNKTNENIF